MRIAWLKSELLHPVDRGGRIRTYALLKALKRRQKITYVCLDDGRHSSEALVQAQEYSHSVVALPFQYAPRRSPGFALDALRNIPSELPLAVARLQSVLMRKWLERESLAREYDAVICDFLHPAVNVPASIAVPTVLFEHNVESEIWRRHAEIATGWPMRSYYMAQWHRMRRFEHTQCLRFDSVAAVSASDKVLLERDFGATDVHVVSTGVDTDYFRPAEPSHRDTGLVVFVGAMDWMPNEDAAQHLLRDILPRVRHRFPAARFSLVGRNPSRALKDLAGTLAGVEVTGTVEDVRPWLERAAVAVVPLRVAGGTRLKIFEAMAMGVPVVSTSVGAEGLPLRHGSDILIADGPDALANAVNGLLGNSLAAAELGARAAHRAHTEFGWDGAADQLTFACTAAIEHRANRQASGLHN